MLSVINHDLVRLWIHPMTLSKAPDILYLAKNLMYVLARMANKHGYLPLNVFSAISDNEPYIKQLLAVLWKKKAPLLYRSAWAGT